MVSVSRNKRPHRLLCLLLVAALLLGIALPVAADTLTLNKVQTSIYVGKTLRLYPTSGTATNWKSSKTSIATVDQSGLVTGIKKGTCTISCRVNGKKLTCTMNVRKKNKSKYVTNKQAEIWLNILGAVESGGMVYGRRNYAAFSGVGAMSPYEVSVTAGAYQEYGENLRQLLLAIQKQYPVSFQARDTAGIAADLAYPWTDSHPYTISPSSTKAKAIQSIISCNAGAFVQDLRIIELLDEYLTDIRALGITNVRAALFMAQCYHLGGFGGVRRVVARASNPNLMSSLKKSLYLDQQDTSSSYQIGDKIYYNRHELIYTWLKAYIPYSAKLKK